MWKQEVGLILQAFDGHWGNLGWPELYRCFFVFLDDAKFMNNSGMESIHPNLTPS